MDSAKGQVPAALARFLLGALSPWSSFSIRAFRLVELESPASVGWVVERALLMKLLKGGQSVWLGDMPDSAA